MNETLFILVAFVSLTLVLVTLRLGKEWLLGLIVAYLLIANIFASKLSIVFGCVTSLAVPIYAAIFLATDTLSEHFGKKMGFKAVWLGFLAQICLAFMGFLITKATAFGDNSYSEALNTIFGFVPRIVAGSFVAYIISQNFDVWFFHFLKNLTKSKHLWLRNIISTTCSQGLDTVIFLSIAFMGKLPHLAQFILTTWVLKIIIAILDTPYMYLSYRLVGHNKSLSNEDMKNGSA